MADLKNLPAFPRPQSGTSFPAQEGMKLLDWFAGQALAGLTANPDIKVLTMGQDDVKQIAKAAWSVALEMMDYTSEPK